MNFYGRQDIIEILNKRADGLGEGYRQNIAIIGEELIGKTYIIQNWLGEYCNNYVVPAYLEVKLNEPDNFPQRFIGTLLYAFLRNSQIVLKDDIDFLIEKAQSYIPNTAKLAKEILCEQKKTKLHDSFFKLFVLAESFYEETKKHCCIILDEFHRIQEFKIKDLYARWRKHIMLSKNTMYILMSSKKHLADKIITNDLNLLFGNFERIDLEPFSDNVARQLIQDRLGFLNVESTLLDFMVYFSASRPFYLDVICSAIIDYHRINPSVKAGVDSLCAALSNIFLDNWGILNKRFSELLRNAENTLGDSLISKLLVALASGSNRLGEASAAIHKTKKETSLLLGKIGPLDLVSKAADVYLLSDRVFGFWLKNIYSVRLNSFDCVPDKQKQIFKERVSLLYNNFNAAQAKVLAERILELFNQFDDEAVRVQKKYLRLNHFKEVKLLNINGRNIKEGIIGRAKNSIWIAGLKEGCADEEDIIEFIDVCKKFKYNKAQKKVFFIFDEIDINARLIAKEKKIIAWDIGCLNSLLEIYGKPGIVR